MWLRKGALPCSSDAPTQIHEAWFALDRYPLVVVQCVHRDRVALTNAPET